MEDLEKKLDHLLSSPDGMKKIEDLMAALGSAPKDTAPTPLPPADDMPDLTAVMRLLPLLGDLRKEDDSAALLKALRPHLQPQRQTRLDEAGQMLKMMRLLPLIGELGKGETHENT